MAALVLLAGVVVLALGGVVGAVLDDPPRRTSTTTTAPATTTTLKPVAELGEVGAEVQALVELGRTVRFHAVYAVSDPELPEGLVQTLELWRDGDMYRSDILERTSNSSRRQSTVSGASTATACETVNGKETCQRIRSAPSDLPGAFLRAVVTAKPVPRLTARDDDVAGYNARCFVAADIGELCLAGDGVMLSITLKDATLLATTVDNDVPASTFENVTGVASDSSG